MRHHIRMPERKINGMVSPKTAPGDSQLRRLVLPAKEGKQLVQEITLELHVPLHPLPRMHAPVVPALTVHGIWTEHLQFAALDLRMKRSDHSAVFVLVKSALGGWKHQQWHSPVSEDKHLDLSMELTAISFVIFAVHR
jgi:hypothetical protein